MSDQLVKIGMTCAVIVLGAAAIGSQLSSSPGLLQVIGKSENAKKAASDADEEAEREISEESTRDAVASGEGSDSEGRPAEEQEGEIKPEEDTADASGGEDGAADNGSGEGDDGEVVYNGIPAGTVTGGDE